MPTFWKSIEKARRKSLIATGKIKNLTAIEDKEELENPSLALPN